MQRQSPAASDPEAATAVMRADLQMRGMPAEVADRTARELAMAFALLPPLAYERALEGIVAAFEPDRTPASSPDPELRSEAASPAAPAQAPARLREVQQLMSDFVGELGKLDEALEVLAAYLRRMRESATSEEPPLPKPSGARLLH